jgi:hypothetical protein
LLEVVRGASSEIEAYKRIQVTQVANVAIEGPAVGEVIHLIAELLDNATTYSPDDSSVEVSSRTVARGVIVEVSDEGLGMKDETLGWANKLMATAPEFDAMALRADSSLGLFVVARLASRWGISVMFEPSRFGGTRATVLIPAGHLVSEHDDAGNTRLRASSAQHDNTAFDSTVNPSLPSQETPSQRSRSTVAFAGEVPATRNVQQRPNPDHALAPDNPAPMPSTHDDTAGTDPARPRLPRRSPQTNLVPELYDAPHDDDLGAGPADKTAQTLTAFHRGTRHGRGPNGTGQL